MAKRDVLQEVAGAILDGESIDWAAIDASAEDADGSLLDQLRALAKVKNVASAPPPQERRVRQWAHLQVRERIGRGAFGDVYRAWDTRLDREVALKLLPAASTGGEPPASSIIEEGRLLARVRHPNVVTIYGAERLGDWIGLWMEFIRGRTLEELLRDGRTFTPEEVTTLGIQLCGAVSAVQAAGLLHRDIKAQNVMLAEDGRLVLMDFGAGREEASHLEAGVTGTPLYLAPELLSGDPATARSEVYSIGVLLYHLLTGAYPVQARDLAGLRQAHARRQPVHVRSVRPDVPSELARVVRRALESEAGARYESADAVGVDLQISRDAAGIAAIPERFHRLVSLGREHWGWTAVAFAGLAAISLGGWTVGRDLREGDEPKPYARASSVAAGSSSELATSSMPLPLTSYPGKEESPSWSPDGRAVAFEWSDETQKNTDIYVVEPGSSQPRRLTTDTGADHGPAWAPDGTWIAYLHIASGGARHAIKLISPSGARAHTLLTSATPLGAVSWFPDSGAVVLAMVGQPGAAAALWVVDVRSGDRHQLTSPPEGIVGDIEPAVSPDGRTLAFSRKTAWRTAELFLLDLRPDRSAAGKPRQITNLGYVERAKWTPDATRILFGASGDGVGIRQVDRDGSVIRPVLGLPDTATQVAMTRRRDGNVSLVFRNVAFEQSILRYAIANTAARPATELVASSRNQSYPQYSSDGKKLAFSSTRSGYQEIWVANADGSQPVQLTSLRNQLTEVGHWSPDDHFIAFVTQGRGPRQLYVVPSSGGDAVPLTTGAGITFGSGWSSDGSSYYYTVLRDGVPDVWKVTRGTGGRHRLTATGGENGFETTGETFYYWKRANGDGAKLMRRTAAGDREVLLIPEGSVTTLAVPARGAFYYKAAGTPAVYRYDERSGRSSLVLRLHEPFHRFTVSPNGRWFALNFTTRFTSDLMMIEHFIQ